LYVGLLLAHLGLLRSYRDGAWWVFAALLTTWLYDIGAYVTGRTVGKRPFMRHISPKKTVEGVAGGLALSTLAGLATVPTVGLRVWQALLLGLLAGVAAQIGDLVESMIKRQAGVKDSGAIFPGHGGVLDRIDSLLFSGALIAYLALLFGYAA
jgi:phosphatidate cytidylyltransferase